VETAVIAERRPDGLLDSIKSALRRAISTLSTLLFIGAMGVLLLMAWANRSEAVWTAEEGWGYAFGIIGGSLMLLLLLYPLRKRWRVMAKWLTVKFWFQTHMVFGVLGPVLIMMHSSYHLGSLNGRVAFFSMLLVAVSGLFGRYFYRRIHYGLYGRKATFDSLRADSQSLERKLGPLFKLNPRSKEMLLEFEERALTLHEGMLASAIHWLTMRLKARRLYRRVLHTLDVKLLAAGQRKQWSHSRIKREQLRMRRLLTKHRRLLRQIQEFHFYERLFSLWHLLHLPLFIMMLISGFVHVYAVHAY